MSDPPLSFGEFIRAQPQGCFMFYGRNTAFNHYHRTCPVHKADTEAYKKVHGSKKRAPANVREAKVEVSKDELSKLMSVGTELAKEIQEIKKALVPKSDDKDKDKADCPVLHPSPTSRLRMYLMCSKIFPRVSDDHPDRSWMLQMGSLSPLSTTCTSR